MEASIACKLLHTISCFSFAFFSNPNTLSDAAGILIPSMILLGSINVRQLENGSGGLMNGMQSY
jgi:hypothetical protein